VAFLWRWLMWVAVRWRALFARHGAKVWYKDAWRILPIKALALPVQLPAAGTVALTLVLWFMVETRVLAAALGADEGRRHAQRPAKKVNRPDPSFRL
jgi:hypothetical protein